MMQTCGCLILTLIETKGSENSHPKKINTFIIASEILEIPRGQEMFLLVIIS